MINISIFAFALFSRAENSKLYLAIDWRLLNKSQAIRQKLSKIKQIIIINH
jgi:hypothetical protein